MRFEGMMRGLFIGWKWGELFGKRKVVYRIEIGEVV